MGLKRFSTVPYELKTSGRKADPPKYTHEPKPAQDWKREIHEARMRRDEAASVSRYEPESSRMAANLADAAVAAQDAYNTLCAAAGVCRVANCYRPVLKGNRRCKSHAPFYTQQQAQPAETQL